MVNTTKQNFNLRPTDLLLVTHYLNHIKAIRTGFNNKEQPEPRFAI